MYLVYLFVFVEIKNPFLIFFSVHSKAYASLYSTSVKFIWCQQSSSGINQSATSKEIPMCSRRYSKVRNNILIRNEMHT